MNLTARQIEGLKDEMRKFQSGIVDIQWELNAAQSAMTKALDEDSIDEANALKLVDRVMAAENAMKRNHLALLIRTRNILNADQVKELTQGASSFTRATSAPMMTLSAPYSTMQWNTAP